MSAKETRSAEAEIEQTEYVAACETAGPDLQRIELVGNIEAPDDRADGRSAHDVGRVTSADQCADHSDVRPAARDPAPKCQNDAWSRAHESRLGIGWPQCRTGSQI